MDVTDEEVNALTHAILKRHGIDFTCYEPVSLKRRINRAVSVLGFNGTHDLWAALLKEKGFIYKFMDEISVGLTSMFRDPILWRTLKQNIPKLFHDEKRLSIWHAGCSTGEEVYTMGIVLKELELSKSARASATDISQEAIAHAQRGEYHKIKLHEFDKNYKEYNIFSNLEKYYTRHENHAVFARELIEHVDFSYHNLITDRYEGSYNIIFCRNVMIYFDNATKIKLMEKFHQALKPGGLLIIGFYDALIPLVNPDLFDVMDLDAKILRARTRVAQVA